MGQRDVWVALGWDSFVRADTITKIDAGDHTLRVKISGEFEARFLDLTRHDSGPPSTWSEDDLATFRDTCWGTELARGLLDAIGAAVAAKRAAEVALRVDMLHRAAVWEWRSTAAGGDFQHRSYWDWFGRPERSLGGLTEVDS